jgi:hypothetical protein
VLEFFKRNLFINSILLLPYAILIRINNLLNPIVVSAQSNHSSLLEYIYGVLSGPIAQGLLSTILVYIQALLINRLVIKHSLTRENSLIPGLLYILLSAFMTEFLYLSGELIGLTFIITAVYIILKTYNQKEVASDMFGSGFLIGLAGLFYFPYYFFLVISALSFLILKSFTFKDRLQHTVGFFVPTFLLLVWEIFVELDKWVIPNYLLANFKFSFTLLIQDMKGLLVASFIGFFMLLSLYNYSKYLSQKATSTQRKIDILYWVTLFSLASILFTPTVNYSHIIILGFPVSIFIAMSFLSFKNKIAAEIIHLFMIIFAIMIQFKVVEI